MNSWTGKLVRLGAQKTCAGLLLAIAFASASYAQTFTPGKKGDVKGSILSRSGDLVKVQDKKTGDLVIVKITDDTKVLSDKSKIRFRRHEDMDVTSLVPGLTINAEGM